ncbi:MAG: hypothetical protein ACJAZX_001533 [Rickettsiales bacterium]|jgi:uncharacterized protein with ParB-like and HNH nuclease domain
MSKTIKDIIVEINNKKFLLPTIQRDFVWLKNSKDNKVEKLLDSLMLGYPVGQVILWKSDLKVGNMNVYQFLGSYDYRKDFNENKKYNKEPDYLVLDGQQRLTALNIVLNGNIINKKGEDEYMYINLLYESGNEEVNDLSYGFKFLTIKNAQNFSEKELWFRVSDIITDCYNDVEDFKDYMFSSLMQKINDIQKDIIEKKEITIKKIIGKLWNNIREKKIHCETSNAAIDDLLNIFVRLNDGGVKLEKADLLLSFMENKGGEFDQDGKGARESITSFLETVNGRNTGLKGHIKLFKDDILKACLVLIDDLEIQYKVSNFNNTTVHKISENWDNIKKALLTTLELMDAYKIDSKSLQSGNSLLPIAFYLKSNGLLGDLFLKTDNSEKLKEQRNLIDWLSLVTFKRVFGSSSDTSLKNIRDYIIKYNKLPRTFKNASEIEKEDIERLVDKSKYQGRNTQFLLKIISPSDAWKYEQDHIFPQDMFEKNSSLNKNFMNSLLNLQLLGRSQNAEKSNQHPVEWINEQSEEYKTQNCIPTDIKIDEDNFDAFIIKRRGLIIKRLEDKLL